MNNRRQKCSLFLAEWMLIMIFCLLFFSMHVTAQKKTEPLLGTFYEFDGKSKYEISGSTPSTAASPLGTLNISGDFKTSGSGTGTHYDVSKDNLEITYSFDTGILSNSGDKWHLYDDSTKAVDGIDIGDKIKNGAIVIQTSLDGEKWVTDFSRSNVFTEDYDSTEVLYSTKDIQLVNGCYYRVIVAYEMEIISGTSQVLFGTTNNKEYKKNAEVYEFYAVNSSEKGLSDPNMTPRKELGAKIGVKKDTGFSQQITIDNKNPHYGWDIGVFSVNGYTRETSIDGDEMFLKNAGDKVTLWFKLSKNIDDLDGSGKYAVVEDKNGSDQYFEVPKTNFKRGTLIIKFADHEGVKHEPIIYTNFLAANATTGADTKAVLFEEGDYEVALDYVIGSKEALGSENDYRIYFKFSIRNGNTMFFPFDLSTGAELRDKAITPNGFTIDMAKSRYLDINVSRTAIVTGVTGHSEDLRFNGPAKDGAEYKEEGVYTVDVTNRYTNEHTVKTFYVGTDPFMVALAKSGKSVKELDEFLAQGYTIETDGSLVAPVEPEEEIYEDAAGDDAQDTEEQESKPDEMPEDKEGTDKDEVVVDKAIDDEGESLYDAEDDEGSAEQDPETVEKRSGSGAWLIVVIIAVGAAAGLIIYKNKKGELKSSEVEEIKGEEDKEK